ncbi:MAG: three-Cys-motif partner protein TcmP [Bacteroidia bacterium]|nr:three-Cys-motif partner protein TcmP [Bacteroidia bacterium]
MSRKDHHIKPYDQGTLDKLTLYYEYVRAWLPVFFNQEHINAIQICDLFAGPGCDAEGTPGSPMLAYEAIKEFSVQNHHQIPVTLHLNEYASEKYKQLQQWRNEVENIPHVAIELNNADFEKAFEPVKSVCRNSKIATLLFLDQNGVKFLTPNVFEFLVNCPTTDFIFFISSAIMNRFGDESEIKDCLMLTEDEKKQMTGKNVHRIVADAYRRYIPKDKPYYLGHFSI